MHPFAHERLCEIFKTSTRNPNLIGTNEGITIEYKQSFGWASISDYLKTMASFANRDGGYIIFGVKDRPHELLGLQDDALDRFQNIDNMLWSTHIREHFYPEINWDKRTYDFNEKTYGIIYTYSAKNKPVMCKRDAGELRKAAIYYRYNSQNSEIDYSELAAIIDAEKEKIHNQWMQLVRRIGDSGIAKTALLDLNSGKMTGPNSTLYIDERLLREISFVQEGSFVETGGDPALVIKGQVQTVVGAQRVIVERERGIAINSDDIFKSFITQEDVDFPQEYIKQICYQTTGNLPVYYFMRKARINTEQTLALLDEIPNNSQVKEYLKNRLLNGNIKYAPIGTGNSQAAIQKRRYLKSILEETLYIPSGNSELKYCVMAFRALTEEQVNEHKDYILNLLYRLYTDFFYNLQYESVKPEIRYTICWIDEALYLNR